MADRSNTLPNFNRQTRYCRKMLIPADQDAVELKRNGCDPDIVFWNGLSLLAQLILDAAVVKGGYCITG